LLHEEQLKGRKGGKEATPLPAVKLIDRPSQQHSDKGHSFEVSLKVSMDAVDVSMTWHENHSSQPCAIAICLGCDHHS